MHATPHDTAHVTLPAPSGKSLVPRPRPGPPCRLVLGLDVDIHFIVVAVQADHGSLPPAQKFTRPNLLAWVRAQVQAGHTVHAVYEACGFGYSLHTDLLAAGAHCLVTTPTRLDPQRRRKNDRLDARQLATRLARFLDGHPDELHPIRIPSLLEQQRRELGRQRDFWARQVRRLESHGRGLRIQFEHLSLPGGWAGPRKWKLLAPQCSDFVRTLLDPLVQQIRACKSQLLLLSQQIEARVASDPLPSGLGPLTVSLLDGEVCDWHRFQHRKAVASYTGCCPSEHSSGGTQRFGRIDRHGNPRVRTLLVEAVWRLLRWQPLWHARLKFLHQLQLGASLKKKTAVALARQLAIDLWRWRTGRASAADLGWVVPRSPRRKPAPR